MQGTELSIQMMMIEYVINWRELDNVTNTVQPEVSGINTGSYCIFKINV